MGSENRNSVDQAFFFCLNFCIGYGGERARRWEAVIELAGFRVLAACEDRDYLMVR